jgi:hypothetical protein
MVKSFCYPQAVEHHDTEFIELREAKKGQNQQAELQSDLAFSMDIQTKLFDFKVDLAETKVVLVVSELRFVIRAKPFNFECRDPLELTYLVWMASSVVMACQNLAAWLPYYPYYPFEASIITAAEAFALGF